MRGRWTSSLSAEKAVYFITVPEPSLFFYQSRCEKHIGRAWLNYCCDSASTVSNVERLGPLSLRKFTFNPTIATLAQMETNEIFRAKRGTCGLNPGDVGLVDGGLQRWGLQVGTVALRTLGGKILCGSIRVVYMRGIRGGWDETVAERSRLSL